LDAFIIRNHDNFSTLPIKSNFKNNFNTILLQPIISQKFKDINNPRKQKGEYSKGITWVGRVAPLPRLCTTFYILEYNLYSVLYRLSEIINTATTVAYIHIVDK